MKHHKLSADWHYIHSHQLQTSSWWSYPALTSKYTCSVSPRCWAGWQACIKDTIETEPGGHSDMQHSLFKMATSKECTWQQETNSPLSPLGAARPESFTLSHRIGDLIARVTLSAPIRYPKHLLPCWWSPALHQAPYACYYRGDTQQVQGFRL